MSTELRHTKYYWVDGKKAQFRAEVEKSTIFTVPVAKFTFEDGKVLKATVQPFQKVPTFSEPFPFVLTYQNSNWKADLREAF